MRTIVLMLLIRILPPAGVGVLLAVTALAPGARNAVSSPLPPMAAGDSCSPEVEVLYPDSHTPITIGNGHNFLRNYVAVKTCRPLTCRFSDRNIAFSKMDPLSNSNNATYHTGVFFPLPGKDMTFYISCQASDGSTTPPVKAEFHVDGQPTDLPTNLHAIATSPTTVLAEWSVTNPDATKSFKIFRDGALVGSTKTSVYLDRDVPPSALHHYSIAAVYASGDQPQTIPVPVMMMPLQADTAPAPPVILDDFENGMLRVMNPNERLDRRNLWNVYPYGDNARVYYSQGIASVTTEDAHSGRYALKGVLSGEMTAPYKSPGGMYLLFLPYTEPNNMWHFMREYLRAGQWKPDTYNRMRFWIKVPREFEKLRSPLGQKDLQIGTYVRSTHGGTAGSGGQESGLGGNHHYHEYNIPYTGEWHQVIFDTHPSHQRGGVGYMEWGDSPYPTGEQGHNYFDAMTCFYLDLASQKSLSAYPATFYFDDFELYKETNPENIDQIYSLNGVYVPSTNEVYVGWSHPKDDEKTQYEVRYAFEDIFKTGWDKARPAPNGLLKPVGGAYNGMEYSSNKLPLAGHDRVMIGIKPANSKRFRQIAIPLRKADTPGTPSR
jgi:hypothetical protein